MLSKHGVFLVLACTLHMTTTVSAQTNSTPAPPPPNPWRTNSTYGWDCTVYTPPMYGAAATLTARGKKLCPFNADSPVCTTASCYFYKPLPTTNDRVCPHPNCDVLITDYCTSSKLAGIHDFGCAVMLRPPFMLPAAVGVGPYVDWLESEPILTPSGYPQVPIIYVDDPAGIIPGGMSAKKIVMQISEPVTNFNATYQASFKAGMATTLGLAYENYIYVMSQTNAAGTTWDLVLNIVGPVIAESKYTTLKGLSTLGASPWSVTVNSMTLTDHIRTGRCYLWDYPTLGSAATALDDCSEDPMYTNLLPMRTAMTGVYSVPSSELDKCAYMGCSILPEIITTGILVTCIVLATFATFSHATNVASRT